MEFSLLPKALDGVHVLLVLLLVWLVWSRSGVEGLMGRAEQPLLPVEGGELSRSGGRVRDPKATKNPEWQKVGASVGAEMESRGIASQTTVGAHDAYYLGGMPYLPQYNP
jgi:hypothetical protein